MLNICLTYAVKSRIDGEMAGEIIEIRFKMNCCEDQAISGQAANSSNAETVSGMSCRRAKFLDCVLAS